jgi:uncharacterized membrane protein YqjE
MARRWAGWGAGPSGAGAVGGPTRLFLAVALVGCVVVAIVLFRDGKRTEGVVAVAAAVYFAARASGLVGGRRDDDGA